MLAVLVEAITNPYIITSSTPSAVEPETCRKPHSIIHYNMVNMAVNKLVNMVVNNKDKPWLLGVHAGRNPHHIKQCRPAP